MSSETEKKCGAALEAHTQALQQCYEALLMITERLAPEHHTKFVGGCIELTRALQGAGDSLRRVLTFAIKFGVITSKGLDSTVSVDAANKQIDGIQKLDGKLSEWMESVIKRGPSADDVELVRRAFGDKVAEAVFDSTKPRGWDNIR